MKTLPLTIAAGLVVSAAAFVPPALADGNGGITPPCVARVNAEVGGIGPDGIHLPIIGDITSKDLAHLRADAVQGGIVGNVGEFICALFVDPPGQPD